MKNDLANGRCREAHRPTRGRRFTRLWPALLVALLCNGLLLAPRPAWADTWNEPGLAARRGLTMFMLISVGMAGAAAGSSWVRRAREGDGPSRALLVPPRA